MNFANPIWLYGLLGLTIPILIHLWSKKEGKTIKVGSIKFFPEGETRQSRKLYPNELLLLLLRAAIITFLVLLIAQPIITGKKSREQPTVLIEASLMDDPQVKSVLDTVLDEGYTVKLLQSGLPDFESDLEQKEQNPSYWDVLKEAETLNSDQLIVFARSTTSQFRGRLPRLSKEVTWYKVPTKDEKRHVIRATEYNGEFRVSVGNYSEVKTAMEHLIFRSDEVSSELQVRKEGEFTQFKTSDQEDWVNAMQLSPTTVVIRFDEGFETDAQLWAAAFRALWTTNGIPVSINSESVENQIDHADVLVWLSEERAPEIQTKSLIYRPNELNSELVSSDDNGFGISRRLSLETITSENVAEELVTNLWRDPTMNEKIASADQRTYDLEMVEPAYSVEGTVINRSNQGVPYIYWIVLIMIVGSERAISFARKQ